MCECMCARICMSVSQSTRSVIIYCLVNLDLPTEMDCLEQTQQCWNFRSFRNDWLALRKGVRACCQLWSQMYSFNCKSAVINTLWPCSLCTCISKGDLSCSFPALYFLFWDSTRVTLHDSQLKENILFILYWCSVQSLSLTVSFSSCLPSRWACSVMIGQKPA